jgi:putative FmdB family regulatory protein
MPLYEYECLECGTMFDSLRAIKDADKPLTCVKCESQHTKRLISLFFAQSDGRTIAATSGGCGSCSGGSCASCGHH